MIRLYDCGDGVFVGNAEACNTQQFERIIHCYKDNDATCSYLLSNIITVMAVKWSEGTSINTASHDINCISDYSAGQSDILIHCLSGHCRSPHLAVIAKVARGCNVFEAIASITKAVYEGCGLTPAWDWRMLTPIVRWAIIYQGEKS